MTFDVHQLDVIVLVGSAVTILAILAVRVSSRAGLPSLLIYLAMGVFLGEAGPGQITFDNAEVAQALGFAALAIILAEGGLTTSWRDFRPSMPIGLSLATVGIAVSVSVMAVGAHYVLGLPWELAVLLGAVTSPTDAAAVFSVLRVVPVTKRLSGALEAESGLNDAPTVVLVTLISTGALGEHGIAGTAAIMVYELVGGVGDRAGRRLRRRLADAAGGAAGVGPLPDRRADADLPRLRRGRVRARVGLRSGVRRGPGARQLRAAAPRGHPFVRGGRRVARSDRAVRDARPAALARADLVAHHRGGPAGRTDPHGARAAGVGRGAAPWSGRCPGRT